VSSSKIEHSPDSERMDSESGETPASHQRAVVDDPPWCNEPEPAPSAGPPAPLSCPRDSIWEPAEDGEEDEAVADDAPDTLFFARSPWR
jgi:hypothetical protein